MLTKQFCITLIIFLMNAMAASAANYFVRTEGNDINCNGTVNAASSSAPNCAFQTVRKASEVAAAGDNVFIQPGTYSEKLDLSNSGNASAEINFTGFKETIIKGNIVISGDYITLNGVTISPPTYEHWGAVTIQGQHNTLRNCLIVNYGASAADQATAIILDSRGAYNTVEGCTIKDLNDIDVFHVNGHDQTIRNNIITNINGLHYELNHTDFIQTWGWPGSSSYNIIVEGNLVTDSGCQLGNLTNDDNPDQRDWIFRNNIFVNIDAALFSGIPKARYYNNLFYKVGRAQGYAVSLYSGHGYSSSGDEFINNIFVDNGKDINFNTAQLSEVNVIANNYFASSDNLAKTNGEEMGINFVNGGDPKFVNPAAFDFHLKSDSVLIGKGANLSTYFNTDKDGKVRSNIWDIGPYAYAAASSSPTNPPSTQSNASASTPNSSPTNSEQSSLFSPSSNSQLKNAFSKKPSKPKKKRNRRSKRWSYFFH